MCLIQRTAKPTAGHENEPVTPFSPPSIHADATGIYLLPICPVASVKNSEIWVWDNAEISLLSANFSFKYEGLTPNL